MSPEFALIEKYFTRTPSRAGLGVGDDCALLSVSPGCEMAISTDTLVSGTHFFPDADPRDLGHKVLAVNLSDLAAMGAIPRAVLLALTLPRVDDGWLSQFAEGFWALADKHQLDLIGGDTTRGPLSMTLTVIGDIEAGRALRRDGAKPGDDLWVSGTLGGAALALAALHGECKVADHHRDAALFRLHRPTPRIALGRALAGMASAAIDVSDGLVADVGHLAARSGLRAVIDWPQVPLHTALCEMPGSMQQRCALSGGDDYELAFTAAPAHRASIEALGEVTRIGSLNAGSAGVEMRDAQGAPMALARQGYDHFGA